MGHPVHCTDLSHPAHPVSVLLCEEEVVRRHLARHLEPPLLGLPDHLDLLPPCHVADVQLGADSIMGSPWRKHFAVTSPYGEIINLMKMKELI